MSKIYTAITKKGRGTQNSTALCYPILSAPNPRWGQKWVRETPAPAKIAKKVPDFPIFTGNPAGIGAGCEIRTRDLMITNCNRHKNPGISKAFCPFSLRNQQLVPAVRSTVSTHKFRPVGQLVGQAFRAESGLDDSDNSPKEGQKAYRGLHSNSERRKSQAFNIWTAISKKSLFPLPYTINQTELQPEYFKFYRGPPAIFGRGIVLARRKPTSIKPFRKTASHVVSPFYQNGFSRLFRPSAVLYVAKSNGVKSRMQ